MTPEEEQAVRLLEEFVAQASDLLRYTAIQAAEVGIPRVLREGSVDIAVDICRKYDLATVDGADRAAANALVAFVGASDRRVGQEIDIQRKESPGATLQELDADLAELRMRVDGYVPESEAFGTIPGWKLTAELGDSLTQNLRFRQDFLSFLRLAWRNTDSLWPTAQSDISEMRNDLSLGRHVARALPSIGLGEGDIGSTGK